MCFNLSTLTNFNEQPKKAKWLTTFIYKIEENSVAIFKKKIINIK